jgi:hypothetical protein
VTEQPYIQAENKQISNIWLRGYQSTIARKQKLGGMHAAISFKTFCFSTPIKQSKDKIYENTNVIVYDLVSEWNG